VENPYAASKLESPKDPGAENNEIRWLIAELDFGSSPLGVLVVREARWQRAIGAALGFLVGIPASCAATVVAVRFGDIGSALLISVFAVLPLGGAVWFLNELLCASCYYVALDDQHFYRRRGPRRLLVLRLDELDRFDARLATLFVYHQPSHKRITVMKNAYAPEDVTALARRMNAWCEAPRGERVRRTTAVNLAEAQLVRARGNRQIAWALRTLCLYPPLIVLSVQLRLFRAGPLAISLWCLLTVGGLLSLLAGIVRRVTATSKERFARSR
jgi:hypothetical protein